MQLPLTTYITKSKTVRDWLVLSSELADYNNTDLWTAAYNDFFLARLQERYLTPINSIKQDDNYFGEGFSIMTIICSLIEFLETTYQGINYKYRKYNDPPLGQYEYSTSKKVFVEFLTSKNPFMAQFDHLTASEFYSKIRCGLLHEARTNGNWTIWGKSDNKCLIEKIGTETIIFRDDFYEAVNYYLKQEYRTELLASSERKDAFLRKFDNLCNE